MLYGEAHNWGIYTYAQQNCVGTLYALREVRELVTELVTVNAA